jgi:hypothetical protein
MSAFTAKNYHINRAPKRIELLGDKKRPEPAQHIIEFPGGAIEVSRTSDGASYWVHVIIHKGQVLDDAEGRESAIGVIEGSRIFREGVGLSEIPGAEAISQIAVLIRPSSV